MTFITILKAYDPQVKGKEAVVILTDSASVEMDNGKILQKAVKTEKISDIGDCLVTACGSGGCIDSNIRDMKRNMPRPTAKSIVKYLRSNNLLGDANFHVVGQVGSHIEILSAGEAAYHGRNYVIDGSGVTPLREVWKCYEEREKILADGFKMFDNKVLTDITDALIQGTQLMRRAQKDNSVGEKIQYGIVTKENTAIILPWNSPYSAKTLRGKLIKGSSSAEKSRFEDDFNHSLCNVNLEAYNAFTSDIVNLERAIARVKSAEDKDDPFCVHTPQYLEQCRKRAEEAREILRQGFNALLTGNVREIISYKRTHDKIFYRDAQMLEVRR